VLLGRIERIGAGSLTEDHLLVAPDRQNHGEAVPGTTGPPPPEASVAERMRHKLRTAEGRAVYKLRKAVVNVDDPVRGATPAMVQKRAGAQR
jgi:hypothetical protein